MNPVNKTIVPGERRTLPQDSVQNLCKKFEGAKNQPTAAKKTAAGNGKQNDGGKKEKCGEEIGAMKMAQGKRRGGGHGEELMRAKEAVVNNSNGKAMRSSRLFPPSPTSSTAAAKLSAAAAAVDCEESGGKKWRMAAIGTIASEGIGTMAPMAPKPAASSSAASTTIPSNGLPQFPSVASLSANFCPSNPCAALQSSPSALPFSSSASSSSGLVTSSASNIQCANSAAASEPVNATANTSNSASLLPIPSIPSSSAQPSIKPKPKIPPKPPKFANAFGKKTESLKEMKSEGIKEINSQKLEKETLKSTAMNLESAAAQTQPHLEGSQQPLRPFSRANSIRRPKCKPPNPVEFSGQIKNAEAAEKVEQSPIIRKPSSRPPPPPFQKEMTAKASAILPPRLPSNPPPPAPPVQTQICQNSCQTPLVISAASIYEEIEVGEHFEEENGGGERPKEGAGNYTPKFRKKETNNDHQREWPKGKGGGGGGRGGGRAQRRRTTQLDNVLLDKPEEEEEGANLYDEDIFEQESSNGSKNGFFTTAPPNSSSPLCRSLFVPSNGNAGSGEFGRIGAGLKQNLAKGMGKLRSRVSAFTSVHQSPSIAAKTFIQENFRTLTLGRTKSERMPGIGTTGKLADRRGRTLSTFYLEGEGQAEIEEKQSGFVEFEENSSAELFGDDWSSSESEEEEQAEIVEEEQKKAVGKYELEEEASPSLHQQKQGEPIAPAAQVIPFCQSSSQSLLAEIESEYQRLQLSRKNKEEKKRIQLENEIEEFKMDEKKEAEQNPTDISQQRKESPLPSKTMKNAESPPPPIPASSFNSSLPDRQPLYQIYLLQREQQRLKLGSSTNSTAEEVTAMLEPIGEIPQTMMVGTKMLALEKEKGPTAAAAGGDEVDSVCPDTSGESEGSAGSSSAHHSLVRRNSSSTTADSGRADSLPLRPLRRERLLGQSVYGSQRSLWCELPEVKESGLLERMDDEQKKQQEAYFEVITSEASYLRSISFLISHFMSAPEFLDSNKTQKPVIHSADRKQLFSNILAIRDCSERLLSELETRMKQGLVLTDICDILCIHFESHFEPYINYCSNQVYQDRTLRKLKTECPMFVACVQRLEADRQCQGLDMRSFLMLPMQRITRYPLLIEAILVWLQPDQHQHSVATRALTLANQVVRNCNEGARRMERTEQLLDIESRLVYKCAELKRIALVSNGRYVVKSGQLTQLAEKRANKPKIGPSRGLKARPLAVFLFNDLVLIAKRRMNGQFVCKDYAFRRFVVLEPMEPGNLRVPPGIQSALGGRSPHLLSCIFLQNARGRQAELLLSAESESDRERWLSAFRPPSCANPDEKIYAEWDCPQALAVHSYEGTQEDELSLCPGDLVNILRKMSDGWYYGERIRDKKGGWFPSSYVQQVMNDHVRAQNYRQRLRIMQSASEFRTLHQPQGGKRASLATTQFSNSFSSPQQYATTQSQETPPILSRFRRLSNPRAYFTS